MAHKICNTPLVLQVQLSQRPTREGAMPGLMGEADTKRPKIATRKRKGMMRLENIAKVGI